MKSNILTILFLLVFINTEAALGGYNFMEKDSIKDSSIYSSLKINPDMLEKFNNFLKKAFPENFEKFTMDFSSVDIRDINKVRELWDQYLYGDFRVRDSIEQAMLHKQISDSIAQALIAQRISDSLAGINTAPADSYVNLTDPAENNNSNQPADTDQYTKNTLNEQENEAKPIHETAVLQKESKRYRKIKMPKDLSYNYPSEVEYRVQIAASRNPMQEPELSSIYTGPVKFTESFEENWYKYISDPFADFSEANNFRTSSNINGAFVVYYYQGQRIKHPKNIQTRESNRYKIQIAASKRILRNSEIDRIYSGTDSIEIQYDGIWYHYLIQSGSSLEEAREKLKDVPVKGAFIVTYKGDIRIFPPLPENN